jgi:hypothetical protein
MVNKNHINILKHKHITVCFLLILRRFISCVGNIMSNIKVIIKHELRQRGDGRGLVKVFLST